MCLQSGGDPAGAEYGSSEEELGDVRGRDPQSDETHFESRTKATEKFLLCKVG